MTGIRTVLVTLILTGLVLRSILLVQVHAVGLLAWFPAGSHSHIEILLRLLDLLVQVSDQLFLVVGWMALGRTVVSLVMTLIFQLVQDLDRRNLTLNRLHLQFFLEQLLSEVAPLDVLNFL